MYNTTILHIETVGHTGSHWCSGLSEPSIFKESLRCLLLLDKILQSDGIEDGLLRTVLDLPRQQELVQYKVSLERHEVRGRVVSVGLLGTFS